MNSKLIIMCGLQCSGKSTKAKEIKEQLEKDEPDLKTVILSSDEIRKEHPEIADDNSKVFNKLYADMNYWLRQGDNVIIDSTNINIKMRRSLFANISEHCEKICYIMNTPYEECKQRLIKRNKDKTQHYVPLEVLEKYYHLFEIPFYYEGWDKIEICNITSKEDSIKYMNDLLKRCENFNQQNKHHTQMLLDHMIQTQKKLLELAPIASRSATKQENLYMFIASVFHDVGKLFTQTFKEGDPNAHYYDHANIGTYELLCNYLSYSVGDIEEDINKSIDRTIKILFYVNYHMKLHDVKTEKAIKKWKNIFGETLYNNLRLFEFADKFRPET